MMWLKVQCLQNQYNNQYMLHTLTYTFHTLTLVEDNSSRIVSTIPQAGQTARQL